MTATAAAVTTAAMIATPLARKGSGARKHLAAVVVGGLAAVTASASSTRWSPRRAIATAAGLASATALVERVGTATGVPFGRYGYTEMLRPRVAAVPMIVPAAWFAMAVPAREAARAALGPLDTRSRRIALGAAALTAWDLFLDPQMVGEGYWTWARVGRYRGIPASNYLGWVVTSAAVMAALELALPVVDAESDAEGDPSSSPDPVLAGSYAAMALMETVGFAFFFRDRRVAAVGGVAMGAVAVPAAARLALRRSGRGLRG